MIVDQSPALELLLSEGVVAGAAGIDRLVQKPWTVRAGAVVVATGGFGANPGKLARYFPSAADTGWAWYIGADGSRGDHLDLAAQVGAQVAGFNRGLRLLHGMRH